MKILNLTEDSRIYTSNVFFVLGEWNTIEDTNTLIDVGSDPLVIQKIEQMNTGLGKRKIDQVIITHSHSDHAAILPEIKKAFNPEIYAFNSHLKGIDHVLKDGDVIRIGEMFCEVIHITVHSYDSICIYCPQNGFLFAGDTNFPIEFENQVLKDENANALMRLKGQPVIKIFPGHGLVTDFHTKPFRLTK